MRTEGIGTKLTVAFILVVCSFFLDAWLYHALNSSPLSAAAPQSQPQPQSESTPMPAIAQPAKTIYLTFDMDMNEVMYAKFRKEGTQWYDPALFQYLEAQNIPATFFVSGLFAETYPGLMQDLSSDANFSFQNHSYDESSFVPGCYWLSTLTNDVEKTVQIEMTQNLIRQTTGQTPSYFRFPGICRGPGDDALVMSLGFQIADGTIVSGDPFTENTGAIVSAVMSRAKNDAVVVMHVGGPNAPKSLEALEIIVPALQSEGYGFSKL